MAVLLGNGNRDQNQGLLEFGSQALERNIAEEHKNYMKMILSSLENP